MACCWDPGFNGNSTPPQSWSINSLGWMSLDIPTERRGAIFSGSPDWIGGGDSLTAWTVYTNAMSRYLDRRHHLINFHHHARFAQQNSPAWMTTYNFQNFGGLHPVAVFVVPDYYINFIRLAYRDKYVFAEDIDFSGDLNTDIPEQLMRHEFFSQWRNWRDTTPG